MDPPYKEIRINQLISLILEKKFKNTELTIHRHKNDNISLTKA